MIKRITFALIFLSITFPLLSQDFIEKGDLWLFETIFYAGPSQPYYNKIDSIFAVKDTVIDSKSYVKLESTAQQLCGVFSTSEYIRIEDQRVYRLSRDLDEEFLIIDFNETDSYAYGFQSPNFSETITGIAEIDSFGTESLIDGTEIVTQYLKLINNYSYNDSFQYKVYENVGFYQPGFLFPDVGTGLCDILFKEQIGKCFISENDTIQFTEIGCYDFTITDNALEIEYLDQAIFPNPTYDGFITVPKNIKLLDIRNINGSSIAFIQNDQIIEIRSSTSGTVVLFMSDQQNAKYYLSKVNLVNAH